MSRSLLRRSRLSTVPLLGFAFVVSGALHAQGDHSGGDPSGGDPSGLVAPFDRSSGLLVPAGLGVAEHLDVDETRRDRVADSFHSVAMRLHAVPPRWNDAAVFHLLAAELRGPKDPRFVSDLALAARLFAMDGAPEAACAAMEIAGRVAVRFGRLGDATRSYTIARGMGRPGCSGRMGPLLANVRVPAPGPISVRAPDVEPRGATRLGLIAAPDAIQVDPPVLVPPISCEGENVLRPRALTPPEVR